MMLVIILFALLNLRVNQNGVKYGRACCQHDLAQCLDVVSVWTILAGFLVGELWMGLDVLLYYQKPSRHD